MKRFGKMRHFSILIAVLLAVMFLGCASEEVPEGATETPAETAVEGEHGEGADEAEAGAEEEAGEEDAHAGEVHWGYEGEGAPEHWSEIGYPDCAGTSQSPIDIPADASVHAAEITFNYNPSDINIVNNGHTVKVEYDEGSSIDVEGKTFNLLQFHFHAPSEHTINNEYYDMELHLVHQSEDGEYAVVGVMLTEGEEDNSAYAPVLDNMPAEEGDVMTIEGVSVNAMDLLPGEKTYYRYDGSFTTPPCTEGVNWFVLNTPVELSGTQISAFEEIYSGNNRPVQPLNDRTFVE